jgi:hypothetical protein
MSCRTAVTSDPEREDEEEVGTARGCGLSPPTTSVAMESSFILFVSASVMCAGGEEGEGGDDGSTVSSRSSVDDGPIAMVTMGGGVGTGEGS